MDVVTLLYYAAICAGLSFAAPALPSARSRLLVGAAVGIGAAALLPVLRTAIG
ncbi:hypothetical protein [Roseovarius aestuariivivens]|uniref:hypothetical protein n=1 Tax=Roseovarius aestuariivivens TaxID=1888910 RepID=UPI00143680C5|nr:hypothetical protein [Roseovarius aestuariivivens]